jgi:hypothetical protein
MMQPFFVHKHVFLACLLYQQLIMACCHLIATCSIWRQLAEGLPVQGSCVGHVSEAGGTNPALGWQVQSISLGGEALYGLKGAVSQYVTAVVIEPVCLATSCSSRPMHGRDYASQWNTQLASFRAQIHMSPNPSIQPSTISARTGSRVVSALSQLTLGWHALVTHRSWLYWGAGVYAGLVSGAWWVGGGGGGGGGSRQSVYSNDSCVTAVETGIEAHLSHGVGWWWW